MSPKIPPPPPAPTMTPQEDHDMEKNSAVTLKRNTKNICTKFTEHIERFSKSRRNMPK